MFHNQNPGTFLGIYIETFEIKREMKRTNKKEKCYTSELCRRNVFPILHVDHATNEWLAPNFITYLQSMKPNTTKIHSGHCFI